MQALADFSMPIIRTVDKLVGATNAMRVDAWAADGSGRTVTLRCAHDDLEDCVGQATAAFALECLRSASAEKPSVKAGVHFPAELERDARASILREAREGAVVWEV